MQFFKKASTIFQQLLFLLWGKGGSNGCKVLALLCPPVNMWISMFLRSLYLWDLGEPVMQKELTFAPLCGSMEIHWQRYLLYVDTWLSDLVVLFMIITVGEILAPLSSEESGFHPACWLESLETENLKVRLIFRNAIGSLVWKVLYFNMIFFLRRK